MNSFELRLFAIDRDPGLKAEFDAIFGQLVSPLPEWTIDQNDDGQYFVKFKWGSKTGQIHDHTSDGLGDGLVSLMSIVDALYDSEPGMTLVFDEPELSLHPQMQRKLRQILSKYASDRQIIYSTHSPYFIDWSDISNGAEIVRCFKEKSRGTIAAQSTSGVLSKIARLSDDTHNPHVLGLDANEVFFLEDHVMLVEGQEDVVYMPKVANQLGVVLSGSLFGWGVGGAEKMALFAQLLQDLQYKKIAGILDGDKEHEVDSLNSRFPAYLFTNIEADDIRTKARPGKDPKIGLLDESHKIRPQYITSTRDLLHRVERYLFEEDANERTT